MNLAIIVRASFASRRERNGVPCLCTPVVSICIDGMRKLSKGAVSSGAHAKVVLLTLSCFKEFEFGNGDGTMEITKTSSVSPATL
jgi:hypothetical protein